MWKILIVLHTQMSADDDKPKKKKKRKVKSKEKTGEKSPNLEFIDPDEPTYCLCEQVSFDSPGISEGPFLAHNFSGLRFHSDIDSCLLILTPRACFQVSYGEMIGCDNDNCAIEWFHFNCVGLTNKPKGKWFCPKCRGDKPTVKRADIK